MDLLISQIKYKCSHSCSIRPVYIRKRGGVDVNQNWPVLRDLFKDVNDTKLVPMMRDALLRINLDRRDEALFVYAAYLASNAKWQWRRAARLAVPHLLKSDNDLFLFCSYAKKLQLLFNRKTFPKSIRKAIIEWYNHQSPQNIRSMWLTHRGEHGITHESLLKMCHINDEIIGEEGAILPFFRRCCDLLAEAEKEQASTSRNVADEPKSAIGGKGKVNKKRKGTGPIAKVKAVAAVPASKKVVTTDIVLAVSRLRTTKCSTEALKIIKKHKLSYNQVPGILLRQGAIMEVIIPTMTYLQLLRSWRHMARHNHFANEQILKLCQTALANKKTLHKSDLHPIRFMIMMRNLGLRSDLGLMPPRKVHDMQIKLFQELYLNSFGQNVGTGKRMHITINLQMSIRSRLLRNQNKVTYLEAAVTTAFAYFKKEAFVEVFYWLEDHLQLEQVPWTKEMGLKEAMACCNAIQQNKNGQRLVAPIMHGLTRKPVYDLFLAIVPTAGRGNPNHSSEFLFRFLDRYRQLKNPQAKYAIVSLLKYRASIVHSDKRNEHMLEICGLDTSTPDLIKAFVLNQIG